MRNERVKRETRVVKIGSQEPVVRRQLNRLPVAGRDTSGMLPKSPTTVVVSLDGVHTIRPAGAGLQRTWQHLPVIGTDRRPLMPTTPWRAERWIRSGKATPFWSKGVFCVRLNQESSAKNIQPIACGIDPGSKKEGFTVRSGRKTFLNIQVDTVSHVKDAVEVRRNMRRSRRFRKTPCRANRKNRSRGGIPPSTKARWQWKLRIARWLSELYPISVFVVEDIKARTKGKRKWDASFSPLEVGKKWFYAELEKLGEVRTKYGWETKEMRDSLGLNKTSRKMAEVFEAHCVDSWVLASSAVGGAVPDNTRMSCVTPLQFHRRQLHALQPSKNGIRRPYGGTRSLEFKRGSVVKHPKLGVCYVGGTMGGRISLHSLEDGRRLCRNAKPSDCKFLTYSSWRTRLLPAPKCGVFAA